MATFAGAYVGEPSDFYHLATERELIEVGDDPGNPDSPDLDTFAVLPTAVQTAIVAVWDALIAEAESYVDTFLRAAPSVSLPLSAPIPPAIVGAAAQVAWVSGLYRRKLLTHQEFQDQRDGASEFLRQLASGKVSLEDPTASTEKKVHSFESTTRVFSRSTLESM